MLAEMGVGVRVGVGGGGDALPVGLVPHVGGNRGGDFSSSKNDRGMKAVGGVAFSLIYSTNNCGAIFSSFTEIKTTYKIACV